MRFVRFLLPLVVLTVAGSAIAGTVSPGLERAFAAKTDDSPLKVMVVMRESVDVQALDWSLHEQEVDFATRHETVITELKSTALGSQAGLVDQLELMLQRREIEGYHAHWLINVVMVTARESVIREIAAREDVETIEPNLEAELIEPVDRREAANKDRGIGITPGVVSVGARRVWNELGITGAGAMVGGNDTGVAGNHPALASRYRGTHAPADECWLDVLSGNTTFPNDGNGHGTHTMGTMVGLAPDDTIGVAPGAEWIATNVINQGAGGGFNNDIITCFEWFADPDGNPATTDDVPDAICNSWGVHEGFGYPDCYSYWWNVIDACEAAGPVVVFAAGNEGPSASSLRSPGDRATTIYNCFTVGATSHTYPWSIANFSSRGPAGPNCGPEENRIKPEVSAPGVGVYSASPSGGYWYMDGTSMAAPHVCGIVALMRSANPNIDVITIKDVLMSTCIDRGTAGEDNTYGHGFVDAFAAVQAVMTGFATVEGTITDSATGDPVSGAVVEIVDGFANTVTATDGSYNFYVPAGTHDIMVSAFGYIDHTQQIVVSEGQILVLDMELNAQPTATISGMVYLPGGSPAANATIVVMDAPVENFYADGLGQYAVTMPAGSDFDLAVSSGTDGYLELTVPFINDLDLDLHLIGVNGNGIESGNLDDFFLSGGANWFAQSTTVHSGSYAAQSGAIGNTALSQMQNWIDCGDGGQMMFWFKTSTQSGDKLKFYVGNDLVGEWDGETDWTQFSTIVGSGTNSFRWQYAKDSAGSAGQDAVWIDDIVYPGGGTTDPQIVAAPTVVAVEMASPTTASASGYLFNQGGGDLSWSLSESADWLTVSPVMGTTVPGAYAELVFDFNALGLPEGVHSAAVTVTSNDPATPSLVLTAQVTVGDGTIDADDTAPKAFALIGAVPNPFNPMTMVRFTLPATQHATLAVYDVRGQLVRTLVDGVRPEGLNEVRWDGRDNAGQGVASGTYFARLRSRDEASVKTLTLIR